MLVVLDFGLKVHKAFCCLKIPLLHEEAAAVKTTKLIIPAANGIPINANNLTNGLLSGSTLSHGIMDMMTANAPT